MQSELVTGVLVACGVLAVLGGLASLLRRDVGTSHLLVAAVVEVAVLVQAVLAVVRLVSGHEVSGGVALFVAYLLFSLVVLPAGALWAVGERNRWSGSVLAVAALALVVTYVRMDAVWLGPGA